MSRVVTTTTNVRTPRTKKNQGGKISNKSQQQTITVTKKTRKRKTRARGMGNKIPIFTECAMDYYKALVDPWAYRFAERLPCIPDLTVVPSYKFNTTVIGRAYVGAGGMGYIAINPHVLGSARGIGWFTSADTYAGNTIGLSAATGLSPLYDTTFPYDGLGALPSFRLVAAGLRVKYTGQELTRSGQVVMGSNDSTNNNYLGYAFENIASQPDTVPQSVTRGHRGCVYKPLNVHSTSYHSEWDYFDGDDVSRMAIIFTGIQGNEFSFEIVRFWEAISDGSTTVPSTSASHSDVTGVSKIRDFIATTAQSEFGQSLMTKGLEYFKRQAVEKGPLLLTYL